MAEEKTLLAADASRKISWPNTGPFQPNPASFRGNESAGPKHQEETGIIPESVDPQIKKTGDQ